MSKLEQNNKEIIGANCEIKNNKNNNYVISVSHDKWEYQVVIEDVMEESKYKIYDDEEFGYYVAYNIEDACNKAYIILQDLARENKNAIDYFDFRDLFSRKVGQYIKNN